MSKQAHMERASRLLGKMKIPRETYCAEELACAAWKRSVGKKIAAHAHAAKLVRTSLIVEVEDEVWRMQLYALRGQILSNLARQIGQGHVEDLEFRVVPLRLGPQRAASASGGVEDEADRISDPGLRRVYRYLRTKALA
jgi:predicted nucleic acid-binding Zn ribbon protein